MTTRAAFVVMAIVQAGAFGFAKTQAPPAPAGPTAAQSVLSAGSYLGDEACAACHVTQSGSFARTAHHQTSRLASADSIAGRFSGPAATMKTVNPAVVFRMEQRPGGFYQTAVTGAPRATSSRSERFDIVTGSARKGQTYLSWRGDALTQLPVSYWVDPGHWINSPGYIDGTAEFDRPILPRCLECHATYFQSLDSRNRYDRSNFVLGVGCEKCHGPGRDHVRNMTSQPPNARTRQAGSAATGIVNTGRLSRDRQVDLCALCHGGGGMRQRVAAFSYRPGEPLDAYLLPARGPFGDVVVETAEVHGNQVNLLKNSQCYQASQMTCSTCHNVHTPQRNLTTMSATCLTCHKIEACKTFPRSGRQIAGKCVDCHMPLQRSNAVTISTNGVTIQPMVRTHWIKVYPNAPAR